MGGGGVRMSGFCLSVCLSVCQAKLQDVHVGRTCIHMFNSPVLDILITSNKNFVFPILCSIFPARCHVTIQQLLTRGGRDRDKMILRRGNPKISKL